jgi:hypothetical protein
VGPVERSGGWVGPPGGDSAPRGGRLASGKIVRWPPAGAGGATVHWGAVSFALVGTEPRGRRLGLVRSSRGEGGSNGMRAGPASAGGVPWDHDNVGIPSLSMSA